MTDAVVNVEKEVDKVVNKFNELRKHNESTLEELIQQIQSYQRDLSLITREYDINCRPINPKLL